MRRRLARGAARQRQRLEVGRAARRGEGRTQRLDEVCEREPRGAEARAIDVDRQELGIRADGGDLGYAGQAHEHRAPQLVMERPEPRGRAEVALVDEGVLEDPAGARGERPDRQRGARGQPAPEPRRTAFDVGARGLERCGVANDDVDERHPRHRRPAYGDPAGDGVELGCHESRHPRRDLVGRVAPPLGDDGDARIGHVGQSVLRE